MRAALREAVPSADEELLGVLQAEWVHRVEREQQRIASGDRPYVNSEVVDREAAAAVTDHVGSVDSAAMARLATAGQRLPPHEDSVSTLTGLARLVPVVALSNASHAALLRLNANAGLRWHAVLSAETVGVYKPNPEAYQLALDATGCKAERVLMVAAHAWDLRGAQKQGIRKAYVARSSGNPPGSADHFDLEVDDLSDLVDRLTQHTQDA